MKYSILFLLLIVFACDSLNDTKTIEVTDHETRFFNVTIEGKINGVESCGIDASKWALVFETKAEPDTVFIAPDGDISGQVIQLKSKIHYEACCLVYVYVSPDCPHKSMASLIDLEMDTLINNIEFCVNESQDIEIPYIDDTPITLEVKGVDHPDFDYRKLKFDAPFLEEPVILKKDESYFFTIEPGSFQYRYKDKFSESLGWEHNSFYAKQCNDAYLELPY